MLEGCMGVSAAFQSGLRARSRMEVRGARSGHVDKLLFHYCFLLLPPPPVKVHFLPCLEGAISGSQTYTPAFVFHIYTRVSSWLGV